MKINKKGFTLIEMLGAVAILGIIATIGIVSVSKVIKSAHQKFDQSQYESLLQAGETYFTDSKSRLPLTPMEWKEITLQELINKKYIEKMLDSNKEEFDYANSKVRVTRLTSGKYQYEAILVRKKGDPIGKISNKVTNQNSGITFALRDKNKYYKENKTYYVRDYPVVDIGISDTDQLSGYQYIIYRNGKQFKKSENIEISGGLGINEAVTLGKEFPFGKYSIKVVVYDKSGNKTTNSTDNSGNPDGGFSIYIDRTKPNCAISIDGKVGDNGWYKEREISLTLKESDKESGVVKHDLQTSKSFFNLNTTGTLTTLVKKQNDTGSTTWYGHVEDKAGNVCETEVTVKVDTKKPKCEIQTNPEPPKSPEPIDSNKWYNMYTKDEIETIKIGTEDDGPSGIYKYILAKNNKTLQNDYRKMENNETLATEEGESTYNGYVRDSAGNDNVCSALLKKDTIPPKCDTAISSYNIYVGSSPAGYSPPGSFTATILDPDVVKAKVHFHLYGTAPVYCDGGGDQMFDPVSKGDVITAKMTSCLGFTGTFDVSHNYWDRAGNAAYCFTEEYELEPTKRRGCTTPGASNYDPSAEESDGSCYWQCTTSGAYNNGEISFSPSSCYWMCTDPEASNFGVKYNSSHDCEYSETEKPKCSDPEASNYNEEGTCEYKCTDPEASNYNANEKCEYEAEEGVEPLSCDDISIGYESYGTKTVFSGNKWTGDIVYINVKIKNSEKIDHWDWWTNYAHRKPSEGAGEFGGCLKGSSPCDYKNNGSNSGDAEKKFEGEGVRKGVIVLYGKKNQTPKKCPTEVYRIDMTPPEITAVCRFNNTTSGYSCTNDSGSNHLYNGVFIRVEDDYVGIGESSYELRGNPSERNGNPEAKSDRYCISSAKKQVDATHKLTYFICDTLSNCRDEKIDMDNFGSFGGTSCSDIKEEHACQVVDKGNVKYKCNNNSEKKCYDKDSYPVSCN